MTKAKAPEDKLKMGRPTKYNTKMRKKVGLLSIHGLTEAEMAQVLNVSASTIDNWKNQHPNFLDTLKNGKDIADREVERSLWERAKGFVMGEGTLTKFFPADVVACIFWLKNRQPARWRDKVELAHTGKVILENHLPGVPQNAVDRLLVSKTRSGDNGGSGNEN